MGKPYKISRQIDSTGFRYYFLLVFRIFLILTEIYIVFDIKRDLKVKYFENFITVLTISNIINCTCVNKSHRPQLKVFFSYTISTLLLSVCFMSTVQVLLNKFYCQKFKNMHQFKKLKLNYIKATPNEWKRKTKQIKQF